MRADSSELPNIEFKNSNTTSAIARTIPTVNKYSGDACPRFLFEEENISIGSFSIFLCFSIV
ncbi:MAG: hypothetical protein QXT25_02450 [Candidatus Anstonellaceae archaeon]